MKNRGLKIVTLILVLIVIGIGALIVIDKNSNKSMNITPQPKNNDYRISSNSLEAFDLYFLKLENTEKNKIYSPLSIKYALEMLNEGAVGDTKTQISRVIGDYEARSYTNSSNMSFANAIFIKNTFKDSVKKEYIDIIKGKYNAEVILDPFSSADTINNWVKEKTLNLLDNLVDDVSDLDVALVNALAIDMEWNKKFLHDGQSIIIYHHEAKGKGYEYNWVAPEDIVSGSFDAIKEEISGMGIIATVNNYDIVGILGEDNIRKTVGDAYREYLNDPENKEDVAIILDGDYSEENINRVISEYLDEYIEDLKGNYHKNGSNTEFSLYVDDDVKVFAKDLKEYNGTTLQYVGIMPTEVSLNTYVDNIDAKTINNILNNLKAIESSNFKDGVVTEIKGYIPKFKFDYSLDLKEDLKELGITNIFDSSKSDLSNISGGLVISTAEHKANIEFTQDGIKAAAATGFGGLGFAGLFNYIYEVPFEEIDLTFNKPYMFLIRDKSTGEVWFVGTVYEPLLYSNDDTYTR